MAIVVTSARAPVPWVLRTPAGSVTQWKFTLTLEDGSPYTAGNATWEYVVRPPLFGNGAPLFCVTTTASDSGLIAVSTSPETVVELTLYPAATEALAGSYRHALYMNPGTVGQFAWVTGSLTVAAAPQP